MKIYSYQTKEKPVVGPVISGNKNKKPKKRKRFNLKRFLVWGFRLTAIGIFCLAILFLYYAKDLPDPNKLMDRKVAESTKIFAKNGELLYEIHGEVKRTLVNLDQISENLKHATIAVEDKNFYNHNGISITGIARAIFVDIITGKKSQGGSTITQQFVKKSMLTDAKFFDRKIREIFISLSMETKFSKDEILKLYLNEIPYGRNTYGIEAASQSYFGKSSKDLSLAESAYLAALPQAPTFYNPMGPNKQSLDNRKNVILGLMREQGYISKEQEEVAKNEVVSFIKTKTGLQAPHFTLMVQDYLAKKYGEKTLQEGGLKVYTTLDLDLQKIAEDAVKTGAEVNAKKYNGHNAALVATDPRTGQILALVGSKDYFADSEPKNCTPGKDCTFEPNVNVATSLRQPGSSFKPYAYVTAFKPDFKFSPASMLLDVETNFGKFGDKDYVPQNYDGKQRGPVSMRQALAGSLNIPAVKTVSLVGVENVVQTARDLGITSPMSDCGLALVLGGCEVKLIDHVSAYGVLANKGEKNEKTFILKIEDKDGNVLEEYKQQPKKVIDEKAVYLLTNIMTDNNARSYVFGPNSPLILPDRPVAAKTGTTQKWHDGWTVGFTPSLAAGVWVGNNDGTFLKQGADGVLVAAPIWNKFMKNALNGKPVEYFEKPAGISDLSVDAVSGKLPTPLTPQTKNEVFADYAIPTEYDDVHINIAFDSQTNEFANDNTPTDRIVYKNFTILHSEKRDNPDWENPVVAWAQAQGYVYPPNSNYITQPTNRQNNENAPIIDIIEPVENQTIASLPFKVVTSVSSQNQISKVTLSIDGQEYKTLNSAPYIFEVNKKYADGEHLIVVKAYDVYNKSADTSVTLKFSLTQPITITEPVNPGLIMFPLSLKAESAEQYDVVNFYYQSTASGSQPKLIEQAENVGNFNGLYSYILDWKSSPKAGEYFIFARTNTGITTQKIKVSVP